MSKDFKAVFFDRFRKSTYGGKWVSLVKQGPVIESTVHESENAARAAVGLEGGSLDRLYEPPSGETGYERVEIEASESLARRHTGLGGKKLPG